MVKYSEDSAYELMELLGEKELEHSYLLLGIINSIDGPNNSANVTLAVEYPETADLDLSEVKFFYHCENSTGTVEDLVNGYKAFNAGDLVYIRFTPEIPALGLTLSLFILGHANIRGVRNCSTEYAFISFVFDDGTNNEVYVHIFDTNAGAPLNLETFVNLPGSPDKPASLPCSQTACASWLVYNFTTTVSPVLTVLGTLSIPSSSSYWGSAYGYEDEEVSVDNQVGYTGTIRGDCSNWSYGNGHVYSDLTKTITYRNYDTSEVLGTSEVSYAHHKTSPQKYSTSGLECAMYWRSDEYSAATRYRSFMLTHYWRVVCPEGTFSFHPTIDMATHLDWDFSAGGQDPEHLVEYADITVSYSGSRKLYIDFSSVGVTPFETEMHRTLTWTGTFNPKPDFSNGTRAITEVSESHTPTGPQPYISNELNTISAESTALCKLWSRMSNKAYTYVLGPSYVYTLIGATGLEEWGDESPAGTGTYLIQGAAGWPGSISAGPTISNLKLKIKMQAACRVTSRGTLTSMSALYPITHYDAAKSTAFSLAVHELAEYLLADVIALGYVDPDDNSNMYSTWAAFNSGPSVIVYKKK